MGGRGSGRRSSYGTSAAFCHEQHSLDIAWLKRRRPLNPGYESTVTWSLGGRETGSIRVETLSRDSVRLVYRTRVRGGEWQDVREVVPVVETATNFGGRQQWFTCLSCGGRARIIYGGTRFRCRGCHGLRYNSQYESPLERIASRCHEIRSRLGHRGPLDDPFPPRPKGMRRKTYERLRAADRRLQHCWYVGLATWLKMI